MCPSRACAAVFSWVPGSDLAEHLSPANLAKLGELMARLHQHALTYRPPAGLELLHYARVFPFPEPVILFEPCFADLFPPERRAVFKQAIQWAQTAIDRLQANGEPMRILHNDLHQWNVRIYRGRLLPIDFEDLMWGWPVQDIATTLYYHLDNGYDDARASLPGRYTPASAHGGNVIQERSAPSWPRRPSGWPISSSTTPTQAGTFRRPSSSPASKSACAG